MSRDSASSHTSSNARRDDDYDRRRRALNEQYSESYLQWWNSLSAEEKAKARAMGVDAPLVDTDRVSGHAPGEDRDAAESNRAQVGFVFAAEAGARSAPRAESAYDGLMTIQRVCGMLISEENPKISVAALAFALNLDALNGLGSLREYAAKIGVSPEALSKKKREWEAELNIPPNAFSKTATAKAALSVAQQTKHWKKKKWKPLSPATPHL